jgi:hypothetical protein
MAVSFEIERGADYHENGLLQTQAIVLSSFWHIEVGQKDVYIFIVLCYTLDCSFFPKDSNEIDFLTRFLPIYHKGSKSIPVERLDLEFDRFQMNIEILSIQVILKK